MKYPIEKYRIIYSRFAAVAVAFMLCVTGSRWEAKNEIVTFGLFLVGMVLVAIASLGRMWCSLYIAGYKNKQLITQGPYSLCRNPLYLFSLIGVVGVGLATETFTYPILFTVFYLVYYPFVVTGEEKRLRELFGAEFDDYSRKTPKIIPDFHGFIEPKSYIVNPRIYRRHIFSALWFVWIVGFLEVLEGLREIGLLPEIWSLY